MAGTKFDFGDESLKVTARPAQELRIKTPKDPDHAARIRQSIPGTLGSMAVTIWFYSLFFGDIGWFYRRRTRRCLWLFISVNNRQLSDVFLWCFRLLRFLFISHDLLALYLLCMKLS